MGTLIEVTPRPRPERARPARDGASRSEAKELTRKALVRGALKLLSRNSFDSISLREVTREAGVSPTAFYRHFEDMEELGLVLVEESFGTLGDMLRNARSDPELYEDAVARSVEVVVRHVHEQTAHMRFIARERYGGIRRLRRAIRRELQLFADELAVDLAQFPFVGRWSTEDRRMFAGLITETMVHMAAELLDMSEEEAAVYAQRTTQQLRFITLAVPYWRSGADPEPT